MADDVKITRDVYVEDNDNPVNQYLLRNGLANVGDKCNRLLLENGDLVLTRGINRIIQHIHVGLRLLVMDWILNQNDGVDYFNGMRGYQEILSAQMKRAINSVDGVDTVLKYSFRQDDDNVIYVVATVKIGNSEIVVNDVINPTSLGV